jgi:tRNA pseudouridine32 synthase/23S rRNA pseudouridine746 synthase
VFDRTARDAFWIAGEDGLDDLAARIDEISERLGPLRAAHAETTARHRDEVAAMRDRHEADRHKRAAARAATGDPAVLEALDRESGRATGERERLKASHRAEASELAAAIERETKARDVLDAERTASSRELLVRIHDTYAVPDARGERRSLRSLFAPSAPPGGAGDCAAPKLLAYAYASGLVPIALAELWCGAPPATGGRTDGAFYPACRGKCGPILAHMLRGLDVEPAPVFGEDAIDPDAPATLFEDAWLAVVAKPAGLLSVPGRSSKADSVLARLRRRYPDVTGPLLVHRLDLDTSGLLLVAKDPDTHGALQRQFAERTIEKRYVAWLNGEVLSAGGVVELPLRVDVDDRPRQIVDPLHGKPAVTQWRVIARESGRTRVHLFPRTGRAHQLRVHASHPSGIGAPIIGDRLYGDPGPRLMLHAEAIAFVHPHTHERLQLELAAPF